MSHHRIEAKDISYAYPDGNRVLKNVSFLITHGQSVGILGANGAGKSTLLHLLTGVIFPTGGEILIGDVLITKKSLPEIQKHIGLIFQNPDDQLFMPTIYDDVAFGPRNARLTENEVKKRVDEALNMAGIAHLKDKAPFRCSGGEKRAAAIASVLSMQPDILILDEPTSDLDPKARRRAVNILKSFSHTKIIATHDIRLVNDLCERTLILQDGIIKADGETRSIITDDKLMDDYGLESINII